MHENKKYRRLLYILSNVALGLSLILFIPFGRTIGKAESIIKFIVIPLIVLGINIVITLKKFEDYRPTSRFLSFASYLPMLSFIVSFCTYLIFISNRAEPNAVYNFSSYIVAVTILSIVATTTFIILFNLEKFNIKLSKNQVNILDVIVYVDFICIMLLAKGLVADKYVNVELLNTTGLNVFVALVIELIILSALFIRNKSLYENNAEFIHRDKQEIIDEWNKIHDDAYYNGELLVLYALNNYAKERLIFEEYESVNLPDGAVAVNKDELNSLEEELKKLKGFKEAYQKKHEALKNEYFTLKNQVKLDVAKTELEGLKKQIEILDSSIAEETSRVNDDINQYNEENRQFNEKKEQFVQERNNLLQELNVTSFDELKAKEEPTPVKVEEKPKVEKVFVPDYQEVLKVAKKVKGENIECNVNPNGTTHKFSSNGKTFLIIQKTSSDYRVTFSVLEEDIMENLRNYPGVINVAKSPKVGNFLQLTNKSEFDKETLFKFINNSLACLQDAERRIQEAKEAQKQARLEAKEQEKRNKELLKEAEKIVAKAQKEAEKEAKEQEKRNKELENASNEEAA